MFTITQTPTLCQVEIVDFLCNELFTAAPVEVMNSDKPSHLLSIIPGGNFEFWSRQQKIFSENDTSE